MRVAFRRSNAPRALFCLRCTKSICFPAPPRCTTVKGVTFCHAPGAEEANESGRYPVVMHVGGNIDPDPGMPKLIKGDNIRRLGEDELQGAVRLNSHGEIGPKLQRLSLPKALRVCAQAPSAGHSSVLSLCGEPVCVVKVSQPHDDVMMMCSARQGDTRRLKL